MSAEERVREALRSVLDPEMGMSVVDLGMIREVEVEEDAVEIKMVLTTPFCPMAGLITEQVREAAAGMEGVEDVEVTLLDEPWDPSWMSR